MSQASALSSQSIKNLDMVPVIYNTAGEGGPGYLTGVDDFVTALTGDTTASVYKMVRIPTTAHVKSVKLWSAVASAGAADINVAFSDSMTDGTPSGDVGTIPQVSSANNKLFGSAASLVAQSGTDVTFTNTFTHENSKQPLWEVLGFAFDPGGYFDIQLNVTTAITTGGIVALQVVFTVGQG